MIDQISDNTWKERTGTKFPSNYCSSCYIELVLAEGDCNTCHATTRHRINDSDNLVPLQRMSLIRAKYIPRIICGCGGVISLTRIANKDFLKELHYSLIG
tara:strand:+ start:555 stop:854 length:300 start_codon:yes stop_codon:yes gene_type:complete